MDATPEQVGQAVALTGLIVYEMTVVRSNLEDTFLALTGSDRAHVMSALVAAELLKLRFTRATWGFAAVPVVLAALRMSLVVDLRRHRSGGPQGHHQRRPSP